MNNNQLRVFVIKPVLVSLDMYSQEAEDLVAGTIAQESRMGHYIHQVGGPALGICQMEPATHKDIWENFISYRKDLSERLNGICFDMSESDMIWNLKYAVTMCRIHYYRKPGAIPLDVEGQAEYWKRHYNTEQGKGTVEEYIDNYERYAR